MPSEIAIFEGIETFFGSSKPAAMLAAGLDTRVLRPVANANGRSPVANALLRKDEWEELDTRIVDVARSRLTIVQDLRSAGLVVNLGGLGTLTSEYEKLGDMSGADIDMAGDTRGEEDTVTFSLVGVPIPIIHKDYSLNIRRLLASRKLGNSLDTTQAQVASRKVADKIEDMIFNGASVTVDGNTIYGITNHPNRNTGSGSDWGTIGNIYTDVNNMIIDAEADNYYGPYNLYVAKTQYAQMRAVYTDGSGQSAMSRVQENLSQINAIRPGDALTDGEAVLVTMLPDVIDLAIAVDISNVQWEEKGGMISQFKVMAALAPRVKADSGSRSGIVHYTGI